MATQQPPARPEPLLTVDEVAELLGVPRSWVYDKSARGELPVLKLGHYSRWRWSDIERALADGLLDRRRSRG